MQKSSSVSLSSLKSIFVLASKSLGLFTSFKHASCCALSPDVKRMLSLVVHSILMWKECCLMLCTSFRGLFLDHFELYIIGWEGGGTWSDFVGTDFDHRSAVLMFCSCRMVLVDSGNAIVEPFFVSNGTEIFPLPNWSVLWLLRNPCQSKL